MTLLDETFTDLLKLTQRTGIRNLLLQILQPNNIHEAHKPTTTLRWPNSLKNDDIHQKHEVFENIIFKALEHLSKAFSNDLAEFPSRRV